MRLQQRSTWQKLCTLLDSTSSQHIYLLAKAHSVQGDDAMSNYYNELVLQQDSLYLPALILKSEHELQGNDFAYAKSLVNKINRFLSYICFCPLLEC
jgi:hypothetical protein